MVERFLGDTIALHAGDCLAVLPTLAENSIDSCCCDPPYHLTSIVQRFSEMGPNDKKLTMGRINPFQRTAVGFMQQKWDGGDVAFRPETWAAVYRVLKPGAHLVAFGGTRTYDLLVGAIRSAGFDVRDTIMWVYSQGFPKNHSLSRQPICECDDGESLSEHDLCIVQQADLSAAECNGKEPADVLLPCVSEQSLSEYGAARTKSESSRPEQSGMGGRHLHRTGQGLSDDPESNSSESKSERLCVGAYSNSRENVGPTVGAERGNTSHQSRQSGQSPGESTDLFQSSRALDDRALRGCGACPRCGKLKKEFEGFGTALKPSAELIVLARKPLSEGTVAANVLRWGTGAINVDGCRVSPGEYVPSGGRSTFGNGGVYRDGRTQSNVTDSHSNGRWPANVVHDGSDDVVAAFPESAGAQGSVTGDEPSECHSGVYSGPRNRIAMAKRGDSGSAARFFYTAKANQDDRLGSSHPTVKPLDLMQWLVRLVTPRAGVVLDPFAGTGTTAEAAWREGMRAVLIEAEPEYQADIRRRMALALAGPDERQRESIKARNLPRDDGPLFGGSYELLKQNVAAEFEDEPEPPDERLDFSREPSPVVKVPRDDGPLFAGRDAWAEMWAKPFDFSQEPRE